jgi:hypothetical protein
MSIYLPTELRLQLEQADDPCCAYCQTLQANSGQRMVPDHIVPESQGGQREFENLCFACRLCNEYKGAKTTGIDPQTGETTVLFHPHQQNWADHFAWEENGTRIIGLTAVGRATIITLNMNNDVIVPARQRWVTAGWHPPKS